MMMDIFLQCTIGEPQRSVIVDIVAKRGLTSIRLEIFKQTSRTMQGGGWRMEDGRSGAESRRPGVSLLPRSMRTWTPNDAQIRLSSDTTWNGHQVYFISQIQRCCTYLSFWVTTVCYRVWLHRLQQANAKKCGGP